MKNMSKKNKIILLLAILLIISGIITFFVAGFEKSMEYKAGTKIEVFIPKGYEKQDIINIADESFSGKEYSLEKIEKLNQVAGIKIVDYSQEELNKFKDNICEKYSIKKDALELHEVKVPEVKINTVIAPYIFPVLLVTVLSLIYVLFKNLKSENKWKNIFKIILVLIFILAVYFALILILRVPFGNFVMPIALAIYVITLIISVNNIKE